MPDTLTFAFTDIVDSTAKNLAIGDAAYVAVAAQHDALIRSIAPDAELKTIGDSFMLRFRDPAEAVGKLVEVQRRLAERPIKIGSESLAVRIGIHIGNPLAVPGAVGQEDYRGTAVNQAARYESLARGGQILISEEVHFLVKDRPHELPGISYHDWGPYYLKGVGWRKVIEVLWNGKAPVAPSGRPQHRSRRFLAPFIGREKELNDIQRYLANPSFPLVTLKGPGGIGKTRLAGEIERRASQLFDDGTFFVELESTPNNPRDVEDQIRAKCGIDTGATEDFFVNKAALLILNTFESVISARNVVQQLLKSCGGLRILATSQVPLHIPGEQVWPVESLEADDAEKMFREYARRHDPGFEITPADREHVEELFRLTDRIPFCLELAAAKIRPGRSLQSIVAGIGQSLGTLGGEMESLRHKSVSACLDWSFSLSWKRRKRSCFPNSRYSVAALSPRAWLPSAAHPMRNACLLRSTTLRCCGWRATASSSCLLPVSIPLRSSARRGRGCGGSMRNAIWPCWRRRIARRAPGNTRKHSPFCAASSKTLGLGCSGQLKCKRTRSSSGMVRLSLGIWRLFGVLRQRSSFAKWPCKPPGEWLIG
jgi:class 3 adenylate cyclase